MHFAGLPKLPSPFSAETQKTLDALERRDAQAKALERLATDPYKEMWEEYQKEAWVADEADCWTGESSWQYPDDWRPESVDRTIRDEEEKEQWGERYLALHKEAEEKRAKQAQAAKMSCEMAARAP